MWTIWTKVRDWCRNSVTILWARIQYVFGVAGAGLVFAFTNYDFTQLVSMDSKAAFKMLLALAVSGVMTEIARRRTLPPG